MAGIMAEQPKCYLICWLYSDDVYQNDIYHTVIGKHVIMILMNSVIQILFFGNFCERHKMQ